MYTALIVAAGSGSRADLGYNKVFFEVKQKPIILFSVDRFMADPEFSEIIVVYAPGELERMQSALGTRNILLIEGGATRQQSVYKGLMVVTNAVVFIHDGARPNLKPIYLEKLKSKLCDGVALTLATKSKDTIKIVQNDRIVGDVPRDQAYLLQTPQVFMTDAIKEAHEALAKSALTMSDDTSVFLKHFGKEVLIVEGDDENIKVTTKFDLMKLEDILC